MEEETDMENRTMVTIETQGVAGTTDTHRIELDGAGVHIVIKNWQVKRRGEI